jgi:hypothetical protein
VKARAQIALLASVDGGLRAPMRSPCRSLLLHVHEQHSDEHVDLGVQIRTLSGRALDAGSQALKVELEFWDDLADLYVIPGRTFTLRHPSRVVGLGQVVEMLAF